MNDFKRHNFKKLKIWQMSMELSKTIFEFGLITQMQRCSVSMPSNIAEGSSRTNKSFSHFLDISLGSSFELQTQLLIANAYNFISDEITKNVESKIEEFQKATMTFQNTLN
jgi:four helix bundle protein